MRLFLAVDLDEKIRERILSVSKHLDLDYVKINFVEEENLHVTLKFLGDVREDDVNKILDDVNNVVKGFNRFDLCVSDLGYFGSPNFIKVLWVGIKDGGELLVKIMGKLDGALGWIRKDDYTNKVPHITIGRVDYIRDKKSFLDKINSIKDVNMGRMKVDRIKLKASKLTRSGPIYEDIATFNLG